MDRNLVAQEKREEWRGLLSARLGHLIEGSGSTLEAGAALNKGMWDILGVKFVANQAPAIMSVHETLQHGYASCTGLSILLVAACRSLGVPARMAGTPEWNRPEGGNHNWVEVYDDATRTWKFTGAAEWSGWDQGWFFPVPAKAQVPRDLMHAIYATSWEMVYPGEFTRPRTSMMLSAALSFKQVLRSGQILVLPLASFVPYPSLHTP